MPIRYPVKGTPAQRSRNAQNAARRVATRALREATAWGVRYMSMKKLVPVDTGALAGSMRTRVRSAGTNLVVGRVFSPLKHTAPVERGRRAGRRPPPTSAIAAWAKRKKLRPFRWARAGRGGAQTAVAGGGLGFAIARAIAAKGIRGAFFFKKTADALRPRMQEFFRRASRAA